MDRRRSALIIVAVWLVLAHAPVAAQDETPAELPIIVIDFHEALRRSDAAGRAREQVDVLRQGYQETFVAIEEELRAAESELADNRTTLSPEAFAERRRQFEERVTEAQREAQSTRASLDQSVERALASVRAQLIEVIADIATGARGYIGVEQGTGHPCRPVSRSDRRGRLAPQRSDADGRGRTGA